MRGSPRGDESHGQRERSSQVTKTLGGRFYRGSQVLTLRAVPSARAHSHQPTRLTRDSGGRGHATTRKLGFPLSSEEPQTPPGNHSPPSPLAEGSSLPEAAGRGRSSQLTPPPRSLLRPFPPAEPSELVPAPGPPRAGNKGSRSTIEGGSVFLRGATGGSDVTPLPVRRIMNDG